MDRYVITISRRFASNGHAIAGRVSEILGIPVYDRSSVEARVAMLQPETEEVSDDLDLQGTGQVCYRDGPVLCNSVLR